MTHICVIPQVCISCIAAHQSDQPIAHTCESQLLYFILLVVICGPSMDGVWCISLSVCLSFIVTFINFYSSLICE